MANTPKDTATRTKTPRPTSVRLDSLQTQLHGMRKELKNYQHPDLVRAYTAASRALEELTMAYADTGAES